MIEKTLRELRLKNGLTQAELGRRVGVGKSAISQYENGLRAPDAAVLIRLAESLHTSTDQLLGRTEFAAREPDPEYSVGGQDLRGYLEELCAQARSIESEEDRLAVLHLARLLADKDRAAKDRPAARPGGAAKRGGRRR